MGDVWLTGDQVADLEEERLRLHARRARIQERMDEIDRLILASGESKVKAMRTASPDAAWAAWRILSDSPAAAFAGDQPERPRGISEEG